MIGKNTEWKQTSRKLHGTGSLRELFRFQERLRNRAQRGDDRLCLRECCMQRRGRRSLVGAASVLDGVRGLFRGPLCLDSTFAWSCRCTRARTCPCDSRPAVEVADDRSRYRPDHRRRRKRSWSAPGKRSAEGTGCSGLRSWPCGNCHVWLEWRNEGEPGDFERGVLMMNRMSGALLGLAAAAAEGGAVEV